MHNRAVAIVLIVSSSLLHGCATMRHHMAEKKLDQSIAGGLSARERVAAMKPEEALSAAAFEEKVLTAGGTVAFAFGANPGFITCHSSTVVETADGRTLVAWFGGTEEGNPDVGIWSSSFDGEKWSLPHCLVKVEQSAHWNPVFFKDNQEAIHLFFKVGKNESLWTTWWMSSFDNGVTWSDPVELVSGDVGGRGPVKNKAITLSDGRWCAPASTEFRRWESFADLSFDQGQSWQRSPDFPLDPKRFTGEGIIQPAFWESAPGQVHALLRSTCGALLRSDSTDYGESWCATYDTGFPNNNSGVDLLKLDDGRLLLVLNPVGINLGDRTPLSLAISSDNGESWHLHAHLEDAPVETKFRFSYPAIVRTRDGVAISYTYKAEKIRCWFIPLAAL